MDFRELFYSIGFIAFSYLVYHFFLKNKRPSSEETNWEGMTIQNYIGLWGCVIIGIMAAIILLFKWIVK